MNIFSILMAIIGVANAILAAWAQIVGGQPVVLPPVRTYIGGHHIELDVTVNPLQLGANLSAPNFWSILFSLVGVAEGLIMQWQTLIGGTPITLPGIKTYISGHHIEFDVAAKTI